ncbi:MAG: hypothetical protein ACRCX2_16135 [Paraclostridium sp.]
MNNKLKETLEAMKGSKEFKFIYIYGMELPILDDLELLCSDTKEQETIHVNDIDIDCKAYQALVIWKYSDKFIFKSDDINDIKLLVRTFKNYIPSRLIKYIESIDDFHIIQTTGLRDEKILKLEEDEKHDEKTMKSLSITSRAINDVYTTDDIEFVTSMEVDEMVKFGGDILLRHVKDTGKDIVINKVAQVKGDGLAKIASALIDRFLG